VGSAARFWEECSAAMSDAGGRVAPLLEPFDRFTALLAEARAVGSERLPEPTAFALGTVGAGGQPSVRILLLKGVDERGFVFYTNYESRKGRELLAQPLAAMCFHWQPLERQVRIEGRTVKVSADEADAYFATRERGSQIGAWASRQSEPMEAPGALAERASEIEARFAGGTVPRPPHWSGFRLVPSRIEFWHNMPSRLHERLLYTRDGDGWRTGILYP
jgi:pyridoxamine 5'-phosphate oxidase